MIVRVFFSLSCCMCLSVYSQEAILITNLSEQLQESSGLLYIEGRLLSHNDSGGLNELYEVDSLTGNISRTVQIMSATNVDWEDICKDDDFIYIGDFGNNLGTRSDLKVYKISISSFLNSAVNEVEAEVINFTYSDQTDFTSAQFTTNFDAEAFIALDESLIIFSKNWGNGRSNVYSLPKTAGTHTAMRIDSIETQGMVTCATVNDVTGEIILAGYTNLLDPFLYIISNYENGNFSQATQSRSTFTAPALNSNQVEGIAPLGALRYFITSESNALGAAGLYSLSPMSPVSIEDLNEEAALIYPNPATHVVIVKLNEAEHVEIYNMNGSLIKFTNHEIVEVNELAKGLYILVVKDKAGETKKISKLSIR